MKAKMYGISVKYFRGFKIWRNQTKVMVPSYEHMNGVSEVFTAVVMKNPIFWDITLCSPLKVS
jgi:hypothetical protein